MGDLLVSLGAISWFIGHIVIAIAAFRFSFIWGMFCLLCCPLGPLLFIIFHFEESKRALTYYVIGILLQVAGVAMGSTLHSRMRSNSLSPATKNLE